jgi:hypothetical protein
MWPPTSGSSVRKNNRKSAYFQFPYGHKDASQLHGTDKYLVSFLLLQPDPGHVKTQVKKRSKNAVVKTPKVLYVQILSCSARARGRRSFSLVAVRNETRAYHIPHFARPV